MSHPSGSPPPPPSVTVADVPADDSATTAHQRAPPLEQRTTTTSSQNSSHYNRQHCTKPPPVPGDAFVAEEAEEKRAARERREAEKEEAKTALPKKKTIWRKLANLILDNGLIELRWISSKMTFQAWKPVIRCALAVSRLVVFRSSRPIMPLSLLPAPGSCLLPIQTGLLSLELLLGLSWHLIYGEIKNPVACGLKERRSPGLRLTLSRSSSLLFVRPG